MLGNVLSIYANNSAWRNRSKTGREKERAAGAKCYNAESHRIMSGSKYLLYEGKVGVKDKRLEGRQFARGIS